MGKRSESTVEVMVACVVKGCKINDEVVNINAVGSCLCNSSEYIEVCSFRRQNSWITIDRCGHA